MIKNKAIRELFLIYKQSARSRKLIFDLTQSEFEIYVNDNCFYCNSEPTRKKVAWNLTTKRVDRCMFNGIDRLDNTEGYYPANCVTCCWRCNKMKMEMSLEDFFTQILRIYNTHLKHELKGVSDL